MPRPSSLHLDVLKLIKLKQRLGIDSGIAGALPEKRKGMSARTFARLLEKTLEAEILADEASLKRLQSLAQIKTEGAAKTHPAIPAV